MSLNLKHITEPLRELNRRKNKYLRRVRSAALCRILNIKGAASHFLPQRFKPARIVFLLTDNKLGDMLAATCLFRETKKLFPSAELYVIGGRTPVNLIKNNPYIRGVFEFSRNLFSMFVLGEKLRKMKIDLLVDLDDLPLAQTFLLIKTIAPKYLIGFDRDRYNFYTVSLPAAQEHITKRHKAVIKLLESSSPNDADCADDKYDLFVDEDCLKAAQEFLASLPKRETYVLNIFSGSHKRDLSFEQASCIAEAFKDKNFVLTGSEANLNKCLNANLPANVFVPPCKGLNTVMLSCALIKLSDGLISPDTFPVHAADAFAKKVFVIFRLSGNSLWLPKHTKHFAFCSGYDYLKDIPPQNIISLLKDFF